MRGLAGGLFLWCRARSRARSRAIRAEGRGHGRAEQGSRLGLIDLHGDALLPKDRLSAGWGGGRGRRWRWGPFASLPVAIDIVVDVILSGNALPGRVRSAHHGLNRGTGGGGSHIHGDLALAQGFGALGLNGLGGIRHPTAAGDQRLFLGRGELGTGGILLQGLANGVVDSLKNGLFIGELDLQLGGMHVDVHPRGVQLNVHHAGGVFFRGDIGGKGLLQRRLGGATANKTVIDEEVLSVAIGLYVIRAADEARDANSLMLAVQREEAGGKILTEHRPNGGFQLSVPRGLQLGCPVGDEADGDLGVGEGHALHVGRDGHGLGGIPLEEFAAGGHVGEQILHDDGGAVTASPLRHAQKSAAPNLQHGAHVILAALGHDAHVRHRGNGGQCFPAEAQGQDSIQILGTADLAGGVTADGHGQILGGHATPVVGDPHEGHAAVLNLHGDVGSPRVDGVLHHFLDGGGGSVHHLARGDEVGDLKGKNLYLSHGRLLSVFLSRGFFPAPRGTQGLCP